MAGKAGQIIPRGERTWVVRVFMGRDSESGKRKDSRMSLDGYLDKRLETAAKPKLRAKTHRDYEALSQTVRAAGSGQPAGFEDRTSGNPGPVCGHAGARPIGPNGPVHACGSPLRPTAGRKVEIDSAESCLERGPPKASEGGNSSSESSAGEGFPERSSTRSLSRVVRSRPHDRHATQRWNRSRAVAGALQIRNARAA